MISAVCFISLILAQQPTRDVTAGASPARPTTVTTGTAVVTGTVVADDVTAAPIRRAKVTLNSADGAVARTTATDDAGRFVVRDLPAGRYNLQATKPAWLSAAYGARRPGRPGTPLAITDGQRVAGIALRMTRGAVITGTVRDERGRPAVGIRIEVGRFALRNGERVIDGVGSGSGIVTTDDTGTYRIFGLPPGEVLVMTWMLPSLNPAAPSVYFRQVTSSDVARATQLVRQSGSSGATAPMTGDPAAVAPSRGPTVKLANVFYPGTTDPGSATAITLAAAEERTGIDFTLRLVPTVRIEGTITDGSGTPQPGVSVVAMSNGVRSANGMGFSGFLMAQAGRDGHYRIDGIGPGDYAVMAGTSQAWAQTEITVTGQDLSVPLTLRPNLTIAGRVVFDGASPLADTGSIRIGVRSTGVMASISALAVQATVTNGRFAFTGDIVPGRYQLTLNGLPAGWYTKSITARGQETLDAPLDIGPNDGTTDWVVTLSDRPSELAGALTGVGGRPALDYFIVVFSADKTFWAPPSRRIVQTRPGSDGRFSVKGLPPGDYWIAALTDVEPDDLLSPAFLESLTSAAVPVKIAEGTKTVRDLKVTGGG